MAYNVSNRYKEIIYSQDDENDIKIWFNGEELVDAGYYVESLRRNWRILPEDGTKRFSLDNFMSQEIELIIHNIDLDIIQDQVEISIGTLVDNNYEYVPIGIFNLQNTPTTNNNKTTITLRDNRVKFDYGYNAKPLMDANDGKATYKQLLQDMCDKAGVQNDVVTFRGENIETGLYDNTITSTTYISYIAEQGGYIAVISREGHLNFVDLSNLTTWRIPLSILSNNYEKGEPYKIERVVYESGTIKYETSSDDALNTLYLNSANPYIINKEQVDNILVNLNNFEIDSVKLSQAILGNPAIDPWDIIEVYDDEDVEETIIFKTLANSEYTFNGKHKQLFVTEIGVEERTENVTLKNEATYRKQAKTDIDELNAQIILQAENTREIQENVTNLQENLQENYYPKSTVEQMIVNAETGVTNTFSEAGGNNILRNTSFSAREVLEQGQIYEYWFGNVIRNTNTNASNGYSIMLQNNSLYQEQKIANGSYTLSFVYRKLNPLAECKVKINDKEYELENTNYTTFQTGIGNIDPINITANSIKVEFISDTVNSCEIYDIMLNSGTIKLAYSQNANEVRTDTVNISKGIEIISSTSEVKFTANNDGIRTKTLNGDIITEFTDKGTKTKELVVDDQAIIVGILRQRVGDQVWDSLI